MLYHDFIQKTKTILILPKTLLKKILKAITLLLHTISNPISKTCPDSNPLKLNILVTVQTAIAIAVFTKPCLTLPTTETKTLSIHGVTIGASVAAGVTKKYSIQHSTGLIASC